MASPQVVALKAALGARIEGLKHADAAKPEVAALLNKALGEHLLVVVPGERMPPAEMRTFASAFGKPRTQLLRYKRSGDVPEASIMTSTLMADGATDKTAIRPADWHTDDSYSPVEASKPEHHCGQAWTVGDCVIWDKRATMHRVDVDYPTGEKRIMQRVLIEGDKPF